MANDVKIEITAQDKTKKAVSSVNKGFSALKRSALGVTSAIASALAAVSGVSSFKSIDALAKTADKLGLATEALISLRHAADQTGVGANTLDMALQRMTRRIAEAAQGTGEAKDALRELGLGARALASMSPDEAFKEIAGAMKEVDSQSDKVRLAFKLFDSEGVNLVNTLALGKSGLNEMASEADSLGMTLSRIDAHKVEEAGDAISRAISFVEGLVNKIVVTLSPAVTDIANAFVNLGTAIKDALDGGTTKPRQLGFILELKKAAEGLSLAFLKIKLSIVKLLAAYLNSFDTKLSNTTDEVHKQTLAFLNASDALDDYNAGLVNAANANINLKSNVAVPAIVDKPMDLSMGFDIKNQSKFMANLKEMSGGIIDLQNKGQGMVDSFAGSLGSTFAQALATGKFAFKDFAKSLLIDLTALILKIALFNLIKAGLTAVGFGGIFGASGGQVTAEGKASGGGLNRGKPFMVGEQGRELFVPKTDGHLVPNHKLGGGDPLTVNFNINAIDTQTGTGFLIKNKQSIVGMIDQAYRKQGRQGVMA
jgi:uncharacterized phage infection (PIP) family protein YhgE